jgi:AcrR family transcriptional regulator
LQAALRVFARDGIDGASVAKIAQAAGMAKGSVYLYFDSKEALAGELVRYLFAFEHKASAPADEPDPLACILSFCDAHQQMVNSLQSDSAVLLHMLSHAGKSRDDVLCRGIRERIAESRIMIQALLDSARSRGLLPLHVDTERASATVLACAYGTLYHGLGTTHIELQAQEVVRTVLTGLGARFE